VKRVSVPWLLLSCAWAVVVVVLGVVPTEEVLAAAAPGREMEVTSAGHFAQYGLLAALLAAALGGWSARPRSILAALALAGGLGVIVESVQAVLPYRDCQVTDVIVNALGAVCGLLLLGVASMAKGRR